MTTHIQSDSKSSKGPFWVVFAFYLLITFEFFYMATPFAVYLYSAYLPGLTLLNSIPGIPRLSTFFLPHIVVETSSALVNAHNILGGILFLTGIITFVGCAIQVYYAKFTRKGEVTNGLYHYVRHPQYAAFMLSSLGMLLLWPRFLVLIMFITVCFGYFLLARIEERECERKFGQSYVEYKNKTGMFLPFSIPLVEKLPALPKSRILRGISIVLVYIFVLSSAVAMGYSIKSQSINSLFALYSPNSASISVGRMDESTLSNIQRIALSDPQVQKRLDDFNEDARFINYIMPTEWYISEVPMQNGGGHHVPRNIDNNRYKMIITLAHFLPGNSAKGKDILKNAVHKTLVVEVWVDLSTQKVTQVMPVPEKIKYDDIPVPVY